MGLDHPRVGIVGGRGRMGSWLAGLLEGHGVTILRAGRKTHLTPAEMARRCDVVVVSIPIAQTVKAIKEIGPFVPENGLLMDLTSIKKEPLEAMLRYSRSEVLGAHPLFGPEEEPAARNRMVICKGRGERGPKWFRGILDKAGIKVVEMEAEEHDRMMGLIQAVNHFSTIALALCVSHSGFSIEDILNCSTQTFRRRLDRIGSMLQQPSGLFESLIMDNTSAGEFIELYLDSVKRMIQMTGAKDREALTDLLTSLKGFYRITKENVSF